MNTTQEKWAKVTVFNSRYNSSWVEKWKVMTFPDAKDLMVLELDGYSDAEILDGIFVGAKYVSREGSAEVIEFKTDGESFDDAMRKIEGATSPFQLSPDFPDDLTYDFSRWVEVAE
tara:strand:- start:1000 stop:1347 length:348 start_codon:yes stop_codon:yes gene_type:complete